MTGPVVPPGGEELRTEWGVLAVWDDGEERTEEFVGRDSETRARYMADFWNARQDGPACTVMRRTVAASAWEPAPARAAALAPENARPE